MFHPNNVGRVVRSYVWRPPKKCDDKDPMQKKHVINEILFSAPKYMWRYEEIGEDLIARGCIKRCNTKIFMKHDPKKRNILFWWFQKETPPTFSRGIDWWGP